MSSKKAEQKFDEDIDDEEDPGSGFYVSLDSIPVEKSDKGTETDTYVKRIQVFRTAEPEEPEPETTDDENDDEDDAASEVIADALDYFRDTGINNTVNKASGPNDVMEMENENDERNKVGILIDLEDHNTSTTDFEEITSFKPQTPERVEVRENSLAHLENEKIVVIIPAELVRPKKSSETPPPENQPRRSFETPPPQNNPRKSFQNPPPQNNPRKSFETPPPVPPREVRKISAPPPADTNRNAPEMPSSSKKRESVRNAPDCTPGKPDIIIGAIDKDEAAMLYDNLLGIGKRVADWLNINLDTALSTNQQRNSSKEKSCKEVLAFQKQIVSIETEYNRIKKEIDKTIKPKLGGCLEEPLYDPEEEIKQEDIQPKIFTPGMEFRKVSRNVEEPSMPSTSTKKSQPARPSYVYKEAKIKNEDCSMPSTCTCAATKKPPVPSYTYKDAKITKRTCSYCLEDRIAKLENELQNHEGNFSHVIAELRACLQYCNSYSEENGDELRARVAALFEIVELHKAALNDWKNDFQNKRKC